MANRLIHETSPYLLAHADNPVDWYPWGEEAFRTAKEKDVPVFLSIGYSACHWCHVMEKECFRDNDVAAVLNKYFVSVKVDREELAAVDHFYMEACQALTGSGGWPLSVFLDHDKRPFFAGTYFPKEDGVHGAGFITVLNKLAAIWQADRKRIIDAGKMIVEHVMKGEHLQTAKPVDFDGIFKKLQAASDKKYGGMKGAPKFPMAPTLMFLLNYKKLKPESAAGEILRTYLDGMAAGGIYDQVGGGFFRYSTDEKWLIPHFEKMLYDNALLFYIYAASAKELEGKYAFTAKGIARYLLSEMRSEDGALYTSEDADSEQGEGAFYLLKPEDALDALGIGEGGGFNADYDITEKGHLNGQSLPNRIGKSAIANDIRAVRLAEFRKKRPRPMRDDKILLSSNALAAAAFAFAGRMLNEDEYIRVAEDVVRFIEKNLKKDGRYYASYKDGKIVHKATSDDYGYLMWAYLELYSATYDFKWLGLAITVADASIALFGGDGGFYLSGADDDALSFRVQKYFDGPVPSGNAILCECLYALSMHTGGERFQKAADGILKAAGGVLDSYPIAAMGLASAAMKRNFAVHVGLTAGEGLTSFIKGLNSFNPFIVTTLYDAEYRKHFTDAVPEGKGKAAAYVCGKDGCKPPVYRPDDIARHP